METGKSQAITIKDPEIFLALKKLSEKTGEKISPLARKKLLESLEISKAQDNLQTEKQEKPLSAQEPVKEERALQAESEISEKLDIIALALANLLSEQEIENRAEIEKEFNERMEKALADQEETLNSKYWMLRFNDAQKDLLVKLLLFRKERGAKYSDQIESMLVFIISYYLENNWFEPVPENFKKEFKEAFDKFLNPDPTPVEK